MFVTCFVGVQSLEKLKSDPSGGGYSVNEPVCGPSDPARKQSDCSYICTPKVFAYQPYAQCNHVMIHAYGI
jgi:hypothetical protein